MKLSLHVSIPGEGVRIVRLDRDRFEIGRHPDSDIVLAGSAVSRCHALLLRTEKSYCVEDLGGFNGVFVGGRRVQTHELAPGDEVVIGDNRLLFSVETESAPEPGIVETFSPLEAQQPWPTLAPLREIAGDIASDIELLVRSVAELDGHRSMPDALGELARRLIDHLGADRVVWWLGPGTSLEPPLVIERHRNRTLAREPLDEDLIECVARSSKPFVRRVTTGHGTRSWIAAPIPLARRPGAVLIAERGAQPFAFGPRELKLISDLGRTIAHTIHRWLEHEHLARSYDDLARDNRALRSSLQIDGDFSAFGGQTLSVRRARRRAQAWVDATGPILIHGESGTGRRRLAELLHFNRSWAWGPLIAISCALQPAGELESQLFGQRDEPGDIAAARGGSLVLLHVEKLPSDLAQPLANLVRGGSTSLATGDTVRATDVRFLAVANRPPGNLVKRRPQLAELIEAFEYRLPLPPLRRIPDDIPILADECLQTASRELGKHLPGIAPSCAALLSRYRWPGNRRELEAVMHRCALRLKDGERLSTKHLSALGEFGAASAET